MVSIVIQPINKSDISWITEVFQTHWSGDFIVSRGKKYYPKELDGFIACIDTQKVGLVTFRNDGDSIEMVSLISIREHQGIGTALVSALIAHAKKYKKRRIWVITTNNNNLAMQFYEHRGFSKVRVYKNAIAKSRKIKPSIPFVDECGIPIRDEIEYEYQL